MTAIDLLSGPKSGPDKNGEQHLTGISYGTLWAVPGGALGPDRIVVVSDQDPRRHHVWTMDSPDEDFKRQIDLQSNHAEDLWQAQIGLANAVKTAYGFDGITTTETLELHLDTESSFTSRRSPLTEQTGFESMGLGEVLYENVSVVGKTRDQLDSEATLEKMIAAARGTNRVTALETALKENKAAWDLGKRYHEDPAVRAAYELYVKTLSGGGNKGASTRLWRSSEPRNAQVHYLLEVLLPLGPELPGYGISVTFSFDGRLAAQNRFSGLDWRKPGAIDTAHEQAESDAHAREQAAEDPEPGE